MTEITHIGQLAPDRRNARAHNPRNIGMIVSALNDVGAARSIVIDEDGAILAGNGTIEAAAQAGIERVRVVDADGEEIVAVRRSGLSPEQKTRLALYDNRTAELATWDADTLAELTGEIDTSQMFTAEELLAALSRVSLDATETPEPTERATLSDRFIVPPFSVLDARQGYWQDRKRRWLAYGIESELGRGGGITPRDSAAMSDPELNHYRKQNTGLLGLSEQSEDYRQRRGNYSASPGGSPRPAATLGADGKTVRGDGRGRGLARTFGQDLMRGEHVVGASTLGAIPPNERDSMSRSGSYSATGPRAIGTRAWVQDVKGEDFSGLGAQQSGTSIFDPVLCELAYRWFCPPAGVVLDPFAGGSVRGIIAALLGRDYIGVDLSGRQLVANEEQAERITPNRRPRWIEGDSAAVLPALTDSADFLFSCPPYADLEVYSDDPRDLSTMDYPAFLAAYRTIIAAAVARLRPDRFACFVVGDVRDSGGLYRNFVSDTIAAFHDAGAQLYNEAILVTAVGSLPIRVGRQFSAGRKLGKTHQNVLVFVKGDARAATDVCGPVEVELPEAEDDL